MGALSIGLLVSLVLGGGGWGDFRWRARREPVLPEEGL